MTMDRLPEGLEKYVEAGVSAAINRPPIESGSTGAAFIREQKTADFTATILAFLNAAEADGWVMAPREATPDMIEAAETVLWERSSQTYNVDIDKIAKAYHAMLKAAKDDSPPPPDVVG